MPIELPALDYAFDALEPHISGDTLRIHHGKHHRSYVEKANKLIQGTPLAGASLEEIVRQSAQRRSSDVEMGKLFNNASQAWNHAFYWRPLRPAGGPKPQGELADEIRAAFGSQAQFEQALQAAATEQFGSGWAWLVVDGGKLRIVTTSNADSPLLAPQRRYWPWTCGNTPITSTTRSAGRNTCRP
jgi:superoxide dismutase, Fe-Mn family